MDEDANALSGPERASLKASVRALDRVPARGAPEAIFSAIARCVPVVGGLVGTLGAGASSSPVSHVVKLPAPVVEGWASTPREQLQRMLAPMVTAGPGEVVSDSQAIVGPFREELDLLRCLDDAGLGESAGYKVSSRPGPAGGLAHHFMTFALDRGAAFTERHRRLLVLLRPAIEAAHARLGVPLVASQPILAQIVDELAMGLLCVSRRGTIVEINERMHALVTRYLPVARVEGGRGALGRFAERAMVETGNGRVWQLRRADGAALAEVSGHWLTKEAHALGEDVVLFVMKEILLAPVVAGEMLTERQWEIAGLLAGSGLSYKEIAARMQISEGTVRKHVEHIYRSAGVHSRAELSTKLR